MAQVAWKAFAGCACFSTEPVCLFDQFELAGPPSLVEPRLEWPVEAQENVPAFAGNGLVIRNLSFPVACVDCRVSKSIGLALHEFSFTTRPSRHIMTLLFAIKNAASRSIGHNIAVPPIAYGRSSG